jgi:hypothetical protein
MNDAFVVGRFERIADLPGDRECLSERNGPAPDAVAQCFAVEILHHQEVDPILAAYVVQRADVPMIQARDDSRFTIEALAHGRVGGDACGQYLNRDDASQASIPRLIDLAHSARADWRHDLVRTKVDTVTECHR